MRSLKDSISKLYASLDLGRRIVGVKFIGSKDEFDAIEVKRPSVPMNYCGMVKYATKGYAIKGSKDDFKCRSGPRVLGIDSQDDKNSKGENWSRLGLYKDSSVSKEVRENLSYNKVDVYGVLVQPIENYDSIPDLVIFITNPYNSMRIMQGYSYHYGIAKNINITGNQAICLECSSRPYLMEDLNASLLCIGTRHRTAWKDEDMAIGIPGSQFENVADGVFRTVNAMESNKNKERIKEEISKTDLSLDIVFDYNYYMDC